MSWAVGQQGRASQTYNVAGTSKACLFWVGCVRDGSFTSSLNHFLRFCTVRHLYFTKIHNLFGSRLRGQS